MNKKLRSKHHKIPTVAWNHKTKSEAKMNALEQFKRKLELRHKKIYSADELADILGISTSYFYKLNGGFLPITDVIKNKMKIMLASDK